MSLERISCQHRVNKQPLLSELAKSIHKGLLMIVNAVYDMNSLRSWQIHASQSIEIR